jgi:serine/threonine-protein kinase HipA
MRLCLVCYLPLSPEHAHYHPACSRSFFGRAEAPLLPYSEEDLSILALDIVRSQTTITGVQPKLSLTINSRSTAQEALRFTVTGLWGSYVLKPPAAAYPQLTEVEDLTMHLAQAAGIKTAEHCLIPMATGSLAYLSKRMDRDKRIKLAMEDMCQLTERLTENKYHSSYEQIAKSIRRYSATPGLDVVNFYELVLFSWITGNADMHLKNFSLLEQPGLGMVLSPAYDLVNTALVNPLDNEEMALTLNGKKRKIKKSDFVQSMTNAGLPAKVQETLFEHMLDTHAKWNEWIDRSFLSLDYKHRYKELLSERLSNLE